MNEVKCPECGHKDLTKRDNKILKYKCKNCGKTFAGSSKPYNFGEEDADE